MQLARAACFCVSFGLRLRSSSGTCEAARKLRECLCFFACGWISEP